MICLISPISRFKILSRVNKYYILTAGLAGALRCLAKISCTDEASKARFLLMYPLNDQSGSSSLVGTWRRGEYVAGRLRCARTVSWFSFSLEDKAVSPGEAVYRDNGSTPLVVRSAKKQQAWSDGLFYLVIDFLI